MSLNFKHFKYLFWGVFFYVLLSNQVIARVPDESKQLIVILSDSWDSPQGKLQRYFRSNSKSKWQKTGTPVPVRLGKNGMAWGRGIYDFQDVQETGFRKEGDQKSPAGLFTIGTSFGFISLQQAKNLRIRMPYIQMNYNVKCIDDSNSTYYNQLIDTSKVKKDWFENNSVSNIAQDIYEWGLFLNHNSDKNPYLMRRQPYAGSCIFLHIWQNEQTSTSGCTALAAADLKKIIFWLDPSQKPALVQLPDSAYQRLQQKWHLP